LRMHYIYGQS